MAIVIEEEKKKGGNILAAFGWIIILVIILGAGYYLFLVPSTPASTTPAPGYLSLQSLSQITVAPQDVAGLPSFQALKLPVSNIVTSSLVTSGRPDPFLAP